MMMMRTAAHLAPETELMGMELLILATVEKKKQTITKNLSSNTFGKRNISNVIYWLQL